MYNKRHQNKEVVVKKLKYLGMMGLWGVIYNDLDYTAVIDSLISLRRLWAKYPDMKLVRTREETDVWLPCDNKGNTPRNWRKAYGKSEKLQQRGQSVHGFIPGTS